MIYALTFLLVTLVPANAAESAAAPETVDTRIAKIFTSKSCSDADAEPLKEADKEIEKFRKELKTKKALEKALKASLEFEQKSAMPVSLLNWVRALDPFLLPKGFPSKYALEGCAADLKTYSDTKTKAALEEWKACLGLAFSDDLPAEFAALESCLEKRPVQK
jgi:hypothetical protein